MAAAGIGHTVLVLEDGTVRLFGNNSDGQTDTPELRSVLSRLAGKPIKKRLVSLKVVQASAGGSHTVLVLQDGTVRAFGKNDYGRTDVPELGGVKVVQASAGAAHTVLVLEDGTVRAFGWN